MCWNGCFRNAVAWFQNKWESPGKKTFPSPEQPDFNRCGFCPSSMILNINSESLWAVKQMRNLSWRHGNSYSIRSSYISCHQSGRLADALASDSPFFSSWSSFPTRCVNVAQGALTAWKPPSAVHLLHQWRTSLCEHKAALALITAMRRRLSDFISAGAVSAMFLWLFICSV